VRATSVGAGGGGGGTRQSVACEQLTARWSSVYACIAGPFILSWRPGTGTDCIFTIAAKVV